jgi:LuxR family maltose regulon positive regulatory protein
MAEEQTRKSALPQDTRPLIEPLSEQEQRVLRLLAAGLSNPEIAGELVISVNTVKTHVKNIYAKLNVNNREDARQAARQLKL